HPDHPTVSQHSWPSTRKSACFSYCCSILSVASILCPLFLAITWFGMRIPDTPDVPDPSSVDLIFAAGGFIMSFPAFLFVQVDEPLGLTERISVYTGVASDGLFWAFASVS